MKTKIFNITFDEDEVLKEACRIIKRGGLVAMPTETVYGLAADGLNPKALKKIFEAKNRPMDNPLILHISRLEQMDLLARNIRDEDREILKTLWPGPLTVVLNKKEIVPKEVSAGLDTVAIRLPSKEITRKFIDYCDSPLAAPSANTSSKPSPTNAQDTLEDMDGKIDAIIDGGDCSIGIESTVLDLTGDIPTILRPGYFTKEDLEKFWPRVDLDLALKKEGQVPKSPGQKYKHYAPKAKVLLLIGDRQDFYEEVSRLLSEENKKIGLMAFDDDGDFPKAHKLIRMGSREDLSYMGKIIFKSLRLLDNDKVDLIIIHGVEADGYGLSIMNRLKKSASGNIKILGGYNEDSFSV